MSLIVQSKRMHAPVPSKAPPRPRPRRVPGARRIVARELPTFSRKFGAMLSAGMPIVAALNTLSTQSSNPHLRTVLSEVKERIEDGSRFSEALSRFPTVFDDFYVNMVRAGETSGQLPESMEQLAGFLENSAKLRRKIKSAMVYPGIVLSIAVAITAGLITFVVPVFADLFAGVEEGLPAPTQFLVDTGEFLKANGLYVLVGIVLVVIAFKKWRATPSGAYLYDRLFLWVPVFGGLAQKVACARFARTLSQMLRSGVPILTAIDISGRATGSKVAERIADRARQDVESGKPLSGPLRGTPIFPPEFVEMLDSGEKTGRIDEMMVCIADFYDDEVDTMAGSLTALLQPILIVVLGLIVGGIVVCMFLPIIKAPGAMMKP